MKLARTQKDCKLLILLKLRKKLSGFVACCGLGWPKVAVQRSGGRIQDQLAVATSKKMPFDLSLYAGRELTF